MLHCGDVLCESGNTITIPDSAGFVGEYTSITIGADGLGLISYNEFYTFYTPGRLRVLHCGDRNCINGNTITVADNTSNDVGLYTSITLGADGLGLISYYDATNTDLKVLHCGNVLCNGGNVATAVDTVGDVGWDTAIALGADGLGLIGYFDQTHGNLKVFHCSNQSCTPYTRVGR